MTYERSRSLREIDDTYNQRREQRKWSQQQIKYESSQTHRQLELNRIDREIESRRSSIPTSTDDVTIYPTDLTIKAQKSQFTPVSDPGTKCHDQASMHFRSGDYERAIESAESAVDFGKKSVDLFLLLGVCYLELERTGAAINILNRAVKGNKSNAEAYFARGVAFEAKDRTADACNDYLKAAELAPSKIEYRTSVADALMELGRFTEAIAEFDFVIGEKRIDADSLSARGYCYEQMGQLAEAFQDYGKAVSINPDDWHHYFDRGRMHLDMNRVTDALGDFEIVINLVPDRPQGYRQRGLCFFSVDDYLRAETDFEKALALEPHDAETHLMLGDCLVKLGKFEEAMKNLSRSEQLYRRAGDLEAANFVSERIRALLRAN